MSKLPDDLVLAFYKHLGLELDAFYFYWAVSTHFKVLTSSYPGFAKYFQAESDEERGHAQQIIDFLIKRGHSIAFPMISQQEITNDNPLLVLEESLEKENQVLDSLNNLHSITEDVDVDVCNFLEDMISEQQNAIGNLTRKINEIKTLVSDGQIKIGLYLYDQKI